jgi:hypothetical protein
MSWRGQNDEPFKLLSVNSSAPPTGSEGSDWVRYRIGQGPNLITGYRQGNLAMIKATVEEIVVGLNERRSPKRGRVQLPRSKAPPKAGQA